jgi:hypothetical protein
MCFRRWCTAWWLNNSTAAAGGTGSLPAKFFLRCMEPSTRFIVLFVVIVFSFYVDAFEDLFKIIIWGLHAKK